MSEFFDRHRPVIVRALRRARSLKDACHNLRLTTVRFSEATCYGLWDGWSGREKTVAGLHNGQETCDVDTAEEYREAYQYGERLRKD